MARNLEGYEREGYTMALNVHRATGSQVSNIREHCARDHYLHRYPDPRSLPFAYMLDVDGNLHRPDGRLNGFIVMKKPQHHRQKDLFGYAGLPTAWQVLDMARVWVHPDLQQPGLNIFSQMVSKVIKRVQWDWLEHHPPRFPDLPYHIELVISYADLKFHSGAAYRACSFTHLGTNNDLSLYYRRLQAPLKAWTPTRPYQRGLLPNMPLVHVK